MPYFLEDLVVDRVDFVDEGANTGAFIEIFKRKENRESMELSEIIGKLKPEHAEVIQQTLNGLNEELGKARTDLDTANEELGKARTDLETANEELGKARTDLETANEKISGYEETISTQSATIEKANEELSALKAKDSMCTCDGEADEDGVCKVCGLKKNLGFDESEVLKSMPANVRSEFLKMRAQKEAAEEQVRKAAEEKLEAEAVAKANTLKSLPVEHEKLVQVIKSGNSDVVEILEAVAAAIDGTVLGEVGHVGKGRVNTDAWSKIEAEAEKIAERDSVTKQKAIRTVIDEHPELYKEYLNGGTN